MKRTVLAMTCVVVALLVARGELYAAWACLFVGSAASISWSEVRAHQRRTGGFTFAAPTAVATLPVAHEDLSDELAVLNAAGTLFSSTIKIGKAAENSQFQYAMDKHKPGSLGGVVEGTAVDRSTVTNRLEDMRKHTGVIQEFRQDYGVTKRTQVTMSVPGVADEVVNSEAKAMTTLKECLEKTGLSQQNAWASGAVFMGWGVSRTIDSGAQPNLPVDSLYRPASAQNVAKTAVTDITESDLMTMLQKLAEGKNGNGVNVNGFCTFDFGTQFDKFFKDYSTAGTTVPVRSFQFDGEKEIFKQSVGGYGTRFGMVKIIPTLMLNATRNNGSLAGASTTNGDATVTVTSTEGLQPYMRVYGTGIPAGAYIESITNATTFELSAAATATGTPTLRLGEWDHCLFLDMEFLELRQNQAPTTWDLSQDGSGTAGYVDAFNGLANLLPKVHGKFHTTAA